MLHLESQSLNDLVTVVEVLVIAFFIVANTFYAGQLVLALVDVRHNLRLTRGEDRARLVSSVGVPRITVLAPAYNEENTIEESVHGLLGLYYPEVEVIIIDDGSNDRTLEVLRRAFALVPVERVYEASLPTAPVDTLYRSSTNPNLLVVQKANGGKADALNAGLNLATGELVCAIDADTLIEPDALLRMVRPFLHDDEVLAAGGTIRIANTSTVRSGRVVEARVPRRPLVGYQVVEYLRAFLFGRMGLNRMGGNVVISGAFGLFRHDSLVRVGGYSKESVGEDMELVVRMRRAGFHSKTPHKVVFIPDPVAWTEAPASARVLGHQRDRWHRGLTQAIGIHRGVLFNPRYGAMGMVVFPYFALVELVAPLIEFVGLLAFLAGLFLGAIDWSFALAFLVFAYGYGTFLTSISVLLEEITYRRYLRPVDKLWLALWVFTENFGYRQITVYWRLRGLFKALFGKGDWGQMERTGFGPSRAEATRPVGGGAGRRPSGRRAP